MMRVGQPGSGPPSADRRAAGEILHALGPVSADGLRAAAARAGLEPGPWVAARVADAIRAHAGHPAAIRIAIEANPADGDVVRLVVGGPDLERLLATRADPGRAQLDVTVRVSAGPEPALALSFGGPALRPALPRRIAASAGVLIGAAIERPDAEVASLPVQDADDATLIERWNATRAEHPGPSTVDGALWSRLAAGDVRVLGPGAELDAVALTRRAERVAGVLRARGVGRGSRVGIHVDRDASMVVALLGVLRAGAAYVPLDPTYPEARLAAMAADAALSALIVDGGAGTDPSWTDAPRIRIAEDGTIPDDAPAKDAGPGDEPVHGPEDAAYVIYTSGSTGVPKGVVVPHRAVVNLLHAVVRRPGVRPDDVVLTVTTLSFDIAVLELLVPLWTGATLVVASRAQAADGHALRALLERHHVSLLQATPSTWRLLRDAGWPGSPRLRALVGGEPLAPDLADWLLARCHQAWNMYGPTETTVWSSCWRVAPRPRGVAIGTPLDNTRFLVLDPAGHPLPVGAVGELHIGGDGLALGYHQRDELTRQRFVPDPSRLGALLYRTGDLGRWAEDGQLEHLGRIDDQLKVRGYRIEPGEVEAALVACDGVATAIVGSRPDSTGEAQLVAWIVAGAPAPDPGALRRALRDRLPHYMLPRRIVVVDRIPLLPNGKVDRKALPAPQEPADAPARGPDALDERERRVADLWRSVLGPIPIGADDNFFDLGGDSLRAARVLPAIERTLGGSVAPRRMIFETLRQLCAEDASRVASVRPAPRRRWLERLARIAGARS